jgi:hypothetical protein
MRKDLERAEVLPVATGDEPPVVARLVVEIRSDGSHTIARGAIEDVGSGQKVAIEARGSTPLSLAIELSRAMFSMRKLGRQVVRHLLPGKKPR